jgi:glc operon protein GlcG
MQKRTKLIELMVVAAACGGAIAHAAPPVAAPTKPAAAAPAAPLVVERSSLTLAGARVAIAAVVEQARRANAGAAVAVVDAGGNMIALERVDGTFAAGSRVSYGKARTAVLFSKPTSFFEQIIKDGRTPMVALDDFTPLQGGVPITVRGAVLGAIGVSGANSAQQDEEFANVGANAVIRALGGEPIALPAAKQPVSSSREVRFFDKTSVDAAFARGVPLLETDGYKVHASRREGPGQAEVHERDTDILRVLSGQATLVTGGKVREPKSIASGEIRGSGIDDGHEQRIAPGDVMIVPAGVPHWFRDVQGPLTYYVVKTH